MESISFDINEALKLYMSDPATIPTPEAESALFECENDPESLTNAVIDPVLDPIIDAVAGNPEAITRPLHMDSLQFLLKCAPNSLVPRVIDVLSSSLLSPSRAQCAPKVIQVQF
jgi:condensin complex subunit 1